MMKRQGLSNLRDENIFLSESWKTRDRNLVRVNDILSELEKQVEPLRRQSETARIYLKKKEELKIYDINMFLMDTIRLKEQMETAQRSFDDANRELTEAKEKQEALKHAYEKQEQKLVEAELQMDGCRTKRDEKHWQNSRRKVRSRYWRNRSGLRR